MKVSEVSEFINLRNSLTALIKMWRDDLKLFHDYSHSFVAVLHKYDQLQKKIDKQEHMLYEIMKELKLTVLQQEAANINLKPKKVKRDKDCKDKPATVRNAVVREHTVGKSILARIRSAFS